MTTGIECLRRLYRPCLFFYFKLLFFHILHGQRAWCAEMVRDTVVTASEKRIQIVSILFKSVLHLSRKNKNASKTFSITVKTVFVLVFHTLRAFAYLPGRRPDATAKRYATIKTWRSAAWNMCAHKTVVVVRVRNKHVFVSVFLIVFHWGVVIYEDRQ